MNGRGSYSSSSFLNDTLSVCIARCLDRNLILSIVRTHFKLVTGYIRCSRLPPRHHVDSRKASFAFSIASFALVSSSVEASLPASLLPSWGQSATAFGSRDTTHKLFLESLQGVCDLGAHGREDVLGLLQALLLRHG